MGGVGGGGGGERGADMFPLSYANLNLPNILKVFRNWGEYPIATNAIQMNYNNTGLVIVIQLWLKEIKSIDSMDFKNIYI